jgi:hypothetical protein
MKLIFPTAAAACLLALVALPTAHAATITPSHIVAVPTGVEGSGNGTLDLRLMTFSGSEIDNASGSFNFDNGNMTLPQGGGADVSFFDESYITTVGDLQSYYALNFPGSQNVQIVLYLDLNETGNGQPNNTLSRLDIILNPTTVQGSPDPSGDVTGAQQAAIDQSYSGGSLLAFLDPEPAASLPLNAQGAGFADYAIATGINPLLLDPTDVLLFNISMDTLNNGAEEIFLSGLFADVDIPGLPVLTPEPGTALLLGCGLIGLSAARRRTRA